MKFFKQQLLLIVLAACPTFASPFLYSFSAPAITTGPVQGVAFTFTFTTPSLLTVQTDLTTLGTLNIPNSFDPNYPTLDAAIFFPGTDGDFDIEFENSSDQAEAGGLLGSAPLDQPGVYDVNWQLTNFAGDVSGNSVGGVLTITDEGSSVPEPSSLTLMGAGFGLAFGMRRRFRGLV